jgi:hypothetical protein
MTDERFDLSLASPRLAHGGMRVPETAREGGDEHSKDPT